MNRVPPLLLLPVALLLAAAAPAQDLAGVRDPQSWRLREVGQGVVLWQQDLDDLFGAPQSLAVLRIEYHPRAHRIRVVDAGGRRKTSAMARETGALAAVNGGFFEPDGSPRGLLQVSGAMLSPAREGQASLGIDDEGRVRIATRPAGGWPGMPNALGAGPLLLRNGEVVDHGERQRSIRHPRTALGRTAAGHLVLLTVDGRNEHAAGMSFEETARVLQALGCEDAINLDGGGSTTMWVAGLGVVNHPSDNETFDAEGEREVGNAIVLLARARLVVDNAGAVLVPAVGWEVDGEGRGFHGEDFAYAADGEGKHAAWTLEAPVSGRYRVQARWPRLTGRAVGHSQLVVGGRKWDLEQRPNGGRWIDLGHLRVEAVDALQVLWRGRAGTPLVIDAVRLIQVAGSGR